MAPFFPFSLFLFVLFPFFLFFSFFPLFLFPLFPDVFSLFSVFCLFFPFLPFSFFYVSLFFPVLCLLFFLLPFFPLKNKTPAKDPSREGLVFLLRTYVCVLWSSMFTFMFVLMSVPPGPPRHGRFTLCVCFCVPLSLIAK